SQGGLNGGANVVAQEMHRAVAEEPVAATGMLAPEMVPVAGVVRVTLPEPLLPPGTGIAELIGAGTPLLRVGQAQGAIDLGINPGPATEAPSCQEGGPLTHHQGIRRAVGDRSKRRGTAPRRVPTHGRISR